MFRGHFGMNGSPQGSVEHSTQIHPCYFPSLFFKVKGLCNDTFHFINQPLRLDWLQDFLYLLKQLAQR